MLTKNAMVFCIHLLCNLIVIYRKGFDKYNVLKMLTHKISHSSSLYWKKTKILYCSIVLLERALELAYIVPMEQTYIYYREMIGIDKYTS